MKKINAWKLKQNTASINALSVKRDWMDETWESHAYHCFPISLTNQLGWGISFPEDITFIWDGISDSSPDHVKILEGNEYAYSGRANATVSFNTGIMFKTEEDTSLLTIPTPNQILDGIMPFTTIISTSFFWGELPCALRVTRPNVEITIKANTSIFSIFPINLEEINNSEINFQNTNSIPKQHEGMENYSNVIYDMNRKGKWSNFYRNATNIYGKSIGNHQVKKINLKINNFE